MSYCRYLDSTVLSVNSNQRFCTLMACVRHRPHISTSAAEQSEACHHLVTFMSCAPESGISNPINVFHRPSVQNIWLLNEGKYQKFCI